MSAVAVSGWLLLAGSALALVIGAELFARNAVATARRFGMSVVALGLLVAGAEPEELVTAVVAALRDHPGLAAGDAIGANVTMLTATLGLAALLGPVPFGPRVRRYAVFASLTGGGALLALAGGLVSRLDGGLLLAGYLAVVTFVWVRERRPPAIGELAEAAGPGGGRTGRAVGASAVGLGLVGLGLMVLGGELAVTGAVRLLVAFDLRESAVGLTAVGLATTVELFALVWAASRRELVPLAVAAVLGSAIYNATVTLGVAALVRPLRVGGLLPAAGLATALPLALVLLSRTGRLSRPLGALLVAGYGGFLVLTLG